MKTKTNKILAILGIVLLATSVLLYFGIIPAILASIASDPQNPGGHGLLITIGPTKNPKLVYVKIDKNGENIYESYFPSGPATSPLDIFVYSVPGDIIEISAKWNNDLSMYSKVKINKLPERNFDKGCIQVLKAGRNDVESRAYFMLVYYKHLGGNSYIPSQILWIESDDIDIVTTTATITATATYTTTITEIAVTTTTSITTTTVTYPYTTTVTDTITITIIDAITHTITMIETYTSTITVTSTYIDENKHAPNIVTSIILGISGITSLILGLRRTT